MTSQENGLIATIAGTIVVIICCFSPVLVILLGAVGLSAFTPFIDMMLFTALGIMIVLTIFSYLRWRKAAQK
jgi:mercuric ion transport protein